MELAPTPSLSLTTSTADKRNLALVGRVLDYMKKHGIENDAAGRKKLAKRMGTNETYLYRYLKNEFIGSLAKFEDLLDGFFTNEIDRVIGNRSLVEKDFCVESVRAFLDHVKAHGHIGVGYGNAGKGKTCGARLYAQKDRTAIYVHVNYWESNAHCIAHNIAKAAGIRLSRKQAASDGLLDRLAGSNRLLILDNFHKAKETARSWVADFWDATRLPIALIGNPLILDQFAKNDQHGSRVGLRRDITAGLKQAAAAATAKTMLSMHFPEGADVPSIIAEATQVVISFGSCRTLLMRSKIAAAILKSGRIEGGPKEAFDLAKTQLIAA